MSSSYLANHNKSVKFENLQWAEAVWAMAARPKKEVVNFIIDKERMSSKGRNRYRDRRLLMDDWRETNHPFIPRTEASKPVFFFSTLDRRGCGKRWSRPFFNPSKTFVDHDRGSAHRSLSRLWTLSTERNSNAPFNSIFLNLLDFKQLKKHSEQLRGYQNQRIVARVQTRYWKIIFVEKIQSCTAMDAWRIKFVNLQCRSALDWTRREARKRVLRAKEWRKNERKISFINHVSLKSR